MSAPKQPTKITLEEWAVSEYGDHAPGIDTLRKWAREGLILPSPEKVGRTWFVRRDAQYAPLPKRSPAAHHVNLTASNEATRSGSRLVDRVRAAAR